MKPKYKIGTFVEFTAPGGSETGVIKSQVISSDSIGYFMKDDASLTFIPESDVLNAYRPIVARQQKTKKLAAAKKSAPKTSSKTPAQEVVAN